MSSANHDEVWLSVPEWEGIYSVSSFGRVRREGRMCGRYQKKFWLEPRILICGPNGDGYPTVRLCDKDRRWHVKVHVLVALAFIGPRPDGMFVCHWDGVKTNNCIENLRYDSPKENAYDSIRHGTFVKSRYGLDNNKTTLTPEQVLEIVASPLSSPVVSKIYGVSAHAVYSIRTGRSWRHLTGIAFKPSLPRASPGFGNLPRAEAFLREHGPARPIEISAAIGCKRTTITSALRTSKVAFALGDGRWSIKGDSK